MTYEQIKDVNSRLRKTDIKGKAYTDVSERIQAFRMLFPDGSIETELLSDEDGVCTFKAVVKGSDGKVLGSGHAQEKESSSFINKTSYIENCETSAVGRALGMLGIGSDTSIASAEEVQNAILNQESWTCEKCRQPVKAFGKMPVSEIVAISQRKYGGIFCADCMTKMKEEREKNA